MKLLFDESLSPRLVALLQDLSPSPKAPFATGSPERATAVIRQKGSHVRLRHQGPPAHARLQSR